MMERFGVTVCQQRGLDIPTPAKAGMKRRALRSAAVWGVVALYLVVYAPAGLGLAALAGSLDNSHQVRVRSGERGLALVLHHGHNCAGHRHGAIARALTCFAQPASATDPDHVIQFGAADSLSPKAQLVLPSFQGPEQPAPVLAEPAFVPSAHTAQYYVPPWPPPDETGPACCIRSTVLLL